jgi:hypothetical protein
MLALLNSTGMSEILETLNDQRPVAVAVNSQMRRWWRTTGKKWLYLEAVLLICIPLVTCITEWTYFGNVLDYILTTIRAILPALVACIALLAALVGAQASWASINSLQSEAALPSSSGRSLYSYLIALRHAADPIAVYCVGSCLSTLVLYGLFDLVEQSSGTCRFPYSAMPEALSTNITAATGIAVLAVVLISARFIVGMWRISLVTSIIVYACEGIVAAHNYTSWEVGGWAGWQPPYGADATTTSSLNWLMVLIALLPMLITWLGLILQSRYIVNYSVAILITLSIARLFELIVPYNGPQSVGNSISCIAYAASRSGLLTTHGIAEYGFWQAGATEQSVSVALRILRLPCLTIQMGDGASLIALLINILWLIIIVLLFSVAAVKRSII